MQPTAGRVQTADGSSFSLIRLQDQITIASDDMLLLSTLAGSAPATRQASHQTHLRIHTGAAISCWPEEAGRPGIYRQPSITSICASEWTASATRGRSDADQQDLTRRGDTAGGCDSMTTGACDGCCRHVLPG